MEMISNTIKNEVNTQRLPVKKILNDLNVKDCFTILNYIAFFILYIVCFMYINKTYTEIIGFGLVFIIHTAFLLFISKDLFYFLDGKKGSDNKIIKPNFAIITSIISIFIGLIFHFISFILTFIMITTLQSKYTKTRGTPIILSKSYKEKFLDYKQNVIIVFTLITLLLLSLFFGYEVINTNYYKLINNFSIVKFINEMPSIIILIISFAIIGISSKQVYISDLFSKLSKKELI
jgi:hypothetical protein